MKIPRHKIFIDEKLEFIYIDMNDISDRYRKEFEIWMHGQTVPVIEDCKNPVYAWDWDRWYKYKRHGGVLIWD